MNKLAANDLKIKGVSIIKETLSEDDETTITVRGKDRYVVMDIERYNYLRVCELEAAYKETLAEIESGEYIEESVMEHVRRLKK